MRQALVALLLCVSAVVGLLSFHFLSGGDTVPAPAWEPAPRPEQLADFSLAAVGGGERSIHDFLDRPLVLNFWATWCPPCLREMPLLEELHAAAGDDFRVVGVAVDYPEVVEDFLNEFGITFPILVGWDEAFDAAYASGGVLGGLPFTVYVDTQGRILAIHEGELLEADVAAAREVMTGVARGEIGAAAAYDRLDKSHWRALAR